MCALPEKNVAPYFCLTPLTLSSLHFFVPFFSLSKAFFYLISGPFFQFSLSLPVPLAFNLKM